MQREFEGFEKVKGAPWELSTRFWSNFDREGPSNLDENLEGNLPKEWCLSCKNGERCGLFVWYFGWTIKPVWRAEIDGSYEWHAILQGFFAYVAFKVSSDHTIYGGTIWDNLINLQLADCSLSIRSELGRTVGSGEKCQKSFIWSGTGWVASYVPTFRCIGDTDDRSSSFRTKSGFWVLRSINVQSLVLESAMARHLNETREIFNRSFMSV